ncbi:aminotransferase class I/II-fold pyridoxal phosphate-dependent enzyme, partial [bacterium]|nr:aminotransferase class I/II-fold pyridoxal phosphate-dependent enzyme [bacterium]
NPDNHLKHQGIETVCVHAGVEPEPVTGAIMTPIFQTSTYVQSAPGEHKGYDYSRGGNPTRTALENALAALEGAAHGISFSSGLAAVHAIAQLLNPGDHVLVCDDVYGGTGRLFRKLFAKYNIDFEFVDMRDPQTLRNLVRPTTRLVWIETPTNPLLRIVDIAAVAQIARSAGALTVVDNTFASPIFQRPLTLGADIVLHSTTTLATTLNGGGAATVQADQTITVSSALSAGGTGLLTLDAGTSIVMNAAITRSGTGGVTLRVASGGVTGSSNIALTGGGALAFDVGGSGSYSGDISGTGSLVKRGAGEQILYGRGDMTGGTTVQAGTLRLVPGSAEGTNRFRWANGEQTITVNSGAVLVLDASAGNGSNQTYLEAGRSLTLTGSGTVQKIGSFSLEMGWSDRRFIVSLASDGLFQVAQGQVSHNYTRDNWRNNQGVLELFVGTTFNTYSENIYVSGLTGFGLLQNTYAAGGNKAIYITSPSGAANYTFGGTVDWYLWIEKAGAGKQTFSGAQGNFGDYVLRGGTLELNGSNWSLNVTSDVRMDAGTTLNIGGNISIGLLGHNTGTPTDTVVNLSNNATLTMGDGGNSTFAGVIQGQGSIAKTQGSGQQTFTNQLTYSGVTQVNAGTLFLSGAGRLPSGGDLIVNGGLLDLNSFSHSMGKLTGTGGSIQLGSGTLTLNQASNGTYAGNIRGTGGLVKNGTGSLTFTNWSDYTGTTTINAGSLYLNRFDSSSGAGTLNTSRVIVNNGGILDWGVANSFGYLANSRIEAITVNEGGQVGRADNSLQQHMWNNFTVEMTGGRFYVGSNTQVMGLTFTIKAPTTSGAISEILPGGGSGDFKLRSEGLNITFDVAQNASALVSAPINTNGTHGTLTKSGLGQLEL